MDKVAVVILNWNGEKMIKKYLPSIIAHTPQEVDIYVADNGSTDESVKILQSEPYSRCKIILFKENHGFAGGYNMALKQIDAEYYVLLNSDVEVPEGWLQPLMDFMRGRPDVAACQPKMLALCDKEKFEYAGACGGFVDKWGYPYCRGRIMDVLERDEGQYDDAIEIHWASGACMLIRAADYWKVGGLDDHFFAHCEEIDLCWRLRLAGRKVYCVPQSHIYHLGGGTLNKSNPFKTYLNFRNNLTMLYKNLPEDRLKKVMRVRLFLDYVAAFKMLILERKMGDFKAVLRGRKDYKKRIKGYLNYKKSHKPLVTEDLTSGYSILWAFYFKGIKRFKNLPPL